MKPLLRIGAALLLLATQPWCWCGAAGPPRPPKAEPETAEVAPAPVGPTLEGEVSEDEPTSAPDATQDSD